MQFILNECVLQLHMCVGGMYLCIDTVCTFTGSDWVPWPWHAWQWAPTALHQHGGFTGGVWVQWWLQLERWADPRVPHQWDVVSSTAVMRMWVNCEFVVFSRKPVEFNLYSIHCLLWHVAMLFSSCFLSTKVRNVAGINYTIVQCTVNSCIWPKSWAAAC